ncbi:MAG: hypothetical protein ACT4PN_06440 [Nitrospiraceae bacterium]
MGLEFPGRAMRRNQVHAVWLEGIIEAIAVIGPIPNEMFGLGLEHVDVEAQLDQGDFMMMRRMRTDGKRKSIRSTIARIFTPLPRFVRPTASPPPSYRNPLMQIVEFWM